MTQHTLLETALATDQKAPVSDQTNPAADQKTPIELWDGPTVGLVTFLLGFPGGTLLACMNWHTIGLKDKVKSHLIAVVLTGLLLGLVQQQFPKLPMFAISILVSIGYAVYLAKVTDVDLSKFSSIHGTVRHKGLLIGCLFGIIGWLVYQVLAFLFAFTNYAIQVLSQPLPPHP